MTTTPSRSFCGFLSAGYAWREVAPARAHAGMSTTIPDMRGDRDTLAGYDGRALAEERRVLGRCAVDLAADGAQGHRRGCRAGRREGPGRAKVGEMAQMVATDVKATMQPDRCAFLPEEAPDAVIKQTLAMAARIHSPLEPSKETQNDRYDPGR
jgi:hypothetical protein